MMLRNFDAIFIAPFGAVGICADEKAVTHVSLLPQSKTALAPKKNTLAYLACVQLLAYLDNADYIFDLPVRLAGSKHQLDVWQAMREIPAGQTRTYGEIAAAIGTNARAVGTACGKNPVPIVVPCHRIVAANGIGGFMGTRDANAKDNPLAIKRWLLTHEGAIKQTTQTAFI
jgi:methylated-DNA-[protein]-cysteine S-methyltransferase